MTDTPHPEAHEAAYFAFIPADVLSDNELRETEQVLFARISSLTKRCGFCWATNEYLAGLSGVKKRVVQTRIKKLADRKHVVVVHSDTHATVKRGIFPTATLGSLALHYQTSPQEAAALHFEAVVSLGFEALHGGMHVRTPLSDSGAEGGANVDKPERGARTDTPPVHGQTPLGCSDGHPIDIPYIQTDSETETPYPAERRAREGRGIHGEPPPTAAGGVDPLGQRPSFVYGSGALGPAAGEGRVRKKKGRPDLPPDDEARQRAYRQLIGARVSVENCDRIVSSFDPAFISEHFETWRLDPSAGPGALVHRIINHLPPESPGAARAVR